MVQWEGVSSGHITYIARKPTPLGFELRTLVCGDSGVLLNAELCEGAEAEGKKAWVDDWVKHTAATLRLTEPYHHTGRCLVADSWFGSYRNAAAHLEVGTFCIMNVKRNKARAPVQELLSKCKKREEHFTKGC